MLKQNRKKKTTMCPSKAMAGAHHELSPSKFPAWAVCPCFESDPAERQDAREGTVQHAALASALSGCDSPFNELSPAAKDSVVWATEYIQSLAGKDKIRSEERVQYKAPDSFAKGGKSEVYFGTADALILRGNLADLIDYKSGGDDRKHRPQLAGYALALFSMRARIKTVRCHVLYGRNKRVDLWSLTQADAAGTVIPILESRQNLARSPSPCEHCSFCGDRMTCPALTERVNAVVKANEWENLLPALRKPGTITDPAKMSQALTVARSVATWADAVRKAATNLAKEGAILPGYRIQERKGTRTLTDLDEAYAQSCLTPAQFVSACKISLPKLITAYADANEMPKTQASQEIETKLGNLIQEAPPSISLVVDRKSS